MSTNVMEAPRDLELEQHWGMRRWFKPYTLINNILLMEEIRLTTTWDVQNPSSIMGYLPYQLVISSTNSRNEKRVRIESMYFLFENLNWGYNTLPETNLFAHENGWLEY